MKTKTPLFGGESEIKGPEKGTQLGACPHNRFGWLRKRLCTGLSSHRGTVLPIRQTISAMSYSRHELQQFAERLENYLYLAA